MSGILLIIVAIIFATINLDLAFALVAVVLGISLIRRIALQARKDHARRV